MSPPVKSTEHLRKRVYQFSYNHFQKIQAEQILAKLLYAAQHYPLLPKTDTDTTRKRQNSISHEQRGKSPQQSISKLKLQQCKQNYGYNQVGLFWLCKAVSTFRKQLANSSTQ